MTINHSAKTGICFGMTSGVITTMGLMVGLDAGTGSRMAVLGGIITIAVADAFSDSLGIHLSEESEDKHTAKEIWQSAIWTFVAKFFVAISFALPFFVFGMREAVIAGVLWGMLLLAFLSLSLARSQKKNAVWAIAEHLSIAILVISVSWYVGTIVSNIFA